MSKVIEDILIRRDGNTRAEAKSRIKEVKSMMEECNYNSDECEDILSDYLGLESDYIFDLLM